MQWLVRDKRGVVARRRINDQRGALALIRAGMIEVSGYMYPNKLTRGPGPRICSDEDEAAKLLQLRDECINQRERDSRKVG